MSIINPVSNNTEILHNQIKSISEARNNKSNNVLELKKAGSMNNKLENINPQIKPKETNERSLVNKIQDLAKKGTDYLKEVKNRALDDKANGVKAFEGANKYWSELMDQVDVIGRKAQDSILDNLALESGNVIADALKGTKLGSIADDILSKFGMKGGAKTATTALNGTSGVGNVLGKATGFAGAAFSLYQLVDGFGKDSAAVSAANGATVGAYVGTMIAPGLGTAIGGAIGGIGGAVASLFGKKDKHPDHAQRDQMRENLEKAGIIDKDHTIGLADGSRFSISIDGKDKLKNLDGGDRFGYEFDPSNKLSHPAIGLLQPLGAVLSGGDEKIRTALTGYFVNAVTSNANDIHDIKENVLAIYEQSGLSIEDVAKGVEILATETDYDPKRVEAYMGGLLSLADEDTFNNIFADYVTAPQEELAA